MLTLTIDGRHCDIDKLPKIPINFHLYKLTDVEGAREGRNIELALPSTPANNLIFGASRDIYSTARFNAEHHAAVIKSGDVAIFKGTVYLLATTISGGECVGYKIAIREGGAEWIDSAVHGDIGDLDIPFSGLLNLSTITDSWSEERAVRFLPIHRGEEPSGYSTSSILPVERVLLTDDYHPFISIREMVRAMFEKSGYTLRSNFLDSDFGRSLFMSGDYSRSDASSAKERCDFFARRSAPATAKADALGRVYASTAFATSTVGAIVDTADPTAIDSNGVEMYETFCTNGSFSTNSAGNICFTPKSSVKAGFLLHLEYATDYKILSRDNFVGFDTVEAVSGVRVEFSLANTCKDYRNEVAKSMQYRALVFEHQEGREYRLLANTASGSYIMGQWSARSALVNTSTTKPRDLSLLYRDSSTASWAEFSGDWALYAGYLEEEGQIDVKMDLRLPTVEVKGGESYVLDKFWFGGAKQGMKITIGTGTTLRPYFTTVPGYGSNLTFQDVAPRKLRQSLLLEAIGEMFNLAFFTDRERKEVFIEPLEALYDGAEEVDISGRIDVRSGIVISDTGLGAPQELELSYIDSDKASHEFNLANNTTLGLWYHRTPLYGTKESLRSVKNPIFTTTLNVSDVLSNAPSASLIRVGDVGIDEEGIDNPFTPHIVCYKGLRELPNGECWIANEKLDHYPYATFLDKEGTNLCFEDRDGVKGLNTYYEDVLARQLNGQTVTLNLHLTTGEMAHLLTADGPKPSVRTIFRFDILGESSRYRLARVKEWEPATNVVQCTFERELKD